MDWAFESEFRHARFERRRLQPEPLGRAPLLESASGRLPSTARMCSFSTSRSFGLRLVGVVDDCGSVMLSRLLDAVIIARSTTLRSSRMLPGHP